MKWKVFPRPIPTQLDASLPHHRDKALDIDDFLENPTEPLGYYLVLGTFDNIPTHEVYDFSFSCQRRNPLVESRTEARNRILEFFGPFLDDKLTKEEHLIKQLGAKPWPRKFEEEHFEWLAYYQVKGLSFETLGKQVDQFRQTVTEGVRGAAGMMIGEWYKQWLRAPRRPGRPKCT
jgi:hypothetical protein